MSYKLRILYSAFSLGLILSMQTPSLACQGNIPCDNTACRTRSALSKDPKHITPLNTCNQGSVFNKLPADLLTLVFSCLTEREVNSTQKISKGFKETACFIMNKRYPLSQTLFPQTSIEASREAAHPLRAIDLISRLIGNRSTTAVFPNHLPMATLNQDELQKVREKIAVLKDSLQFGTVARGLLESFIMYLEGQPLQTPLLQQIIARYKANALIGNHAPSLEVFALCSLYGIGTEQNLSQARESAKAESNYFKNFKNRKSQKNLSLTDITATSEKFRYLDLIIALRTLPVLKVQDPTTQSNVPPIPEVDHEIYDRWKEVFSNPYSILKDKRTAVTNYRNAHLHTYAVEIGETILLDPTHTLIDKRSAVICHHRAKNFTRAAEISETILLDPTHTLIDKRVAAFNHNQAKNFTRAAEISETILLDPTHILDDKRGAVINHRGAENFTRAAEIGETILLDPTHTLEDKRMANLDHSEAENFTRAAEIGEIILLDPTHILDDKRDAVIDHRNTKNFTRAAEISETILLDPTHILDDKRDAVINYRDAKNFTRAAEISETILLDPTHILDDKRDAVINHRDAKNFTRAAEISATIL